MSDRIDEKGVEKEEVTEISEIKEPLYTNTYRIGSHNGMFKIEFGSWEGPNQVNIRAKIILEDLQIWAFITDMIDSCVKYELATGKEVIPEEVKTYASSEEDE